MNNRRFATAIHILTLLAVHEGEFLSSDYIASSINVNPVVVRKEIAVLKEAHLVEARKGKEGGCKLARKPSEIKISEIYSVVRNVDVLGKKNDNPNPNCPIGKNINTKLDALYNQTDELVFAFLSLKNLEDFAFKFPDLYNEFAT